MIIANPVFVKEGRKIMFGNKMAKIEKMAQKGDAHNLKALDKARKPEVRLAAIDALYFVVLYLVIGQQVNLIPVACVVIAGFLLVVCFGGMAPDKTFGQGLKAGLGNAFTVFLNTISAFGNIMSYIRLFAVGMASLAIAQSFNNMALGFKGP